MRSVDHVALCPAVNVPGTDPPALVAEATAGVSERQCSESHHGQSQPLGGGKKGKKECRLLWSQQQLSTVATGTGRNNETKL